MDGLQNRCILGHHCNIVYVPYYRDCAHQQSEDDDYRADYSHDFDQFFEAD
ncbi:MAG: hypothetical protein RQM92_11915 [Candidatus Syntrophopropionicum ammoniitolerans]